MKKYFSLLLLLIFIFYIAEFGNSVVVSAKIFPGFTTKLVEQANIKNPQTNTPFNQKEYNLSLEKKLGSHLTRLDKPVVMVKTNLFSCMLQSVNSEKLCNILHDCNIELCKTIEGRSNLIVYGNEPIYSIITSNTGKSSNEIKLKPGEYEILFKNHDLRSINYCNEIVLDGLSFNEFTVGIDLPNDKNSIVCINISDGCYGTIKIRETKICQIQEVLLKKLY